MIGPWINIFQLNLKLTKKFIMLFPSGSEPKFEMTGRFVKKPRYFDKNYWPPPEMVHFKIHIELKTEKSLTVCFNCPFKNLTFLNFFFEFSSSEIFFYSKTLISAPSQPRKLLHYIIFHFSSHYAFVPLLSVKEKLVKVLDLA